MSLVMAASGSDRRPFRLALVIALAGLAAWGGLETIRFVLWSWTLERGGNPYFIPGHVLALYVVTPLATLAMSVFFLSPGLVLAAAFGREKRLAEWLISALAVACVALPAATMLWELSTGAALRGTGFLGFVAGVNVVALLVLAMRLAAGGGFRVNLAGQGADIGMALALFLAVLILLSPKFYWENFSADGSGSLQFARNFIHTYWPFWAAEAGTIKQAPGLTSFFFVIPDSWFVRTIGEWEYSVRVLQPMALALLYPVVTALIRTGRPGAELSLADHVLIAAALALYSFANIYSGGYHAWFGDSPMPVARETLAMVAFLGFILAFIEDRRVLMLTAAVMAHLSIPTGGFWLLLWPVAVFLTWRPRPVPRLRFAVVILAVGASISILGPVLVKLSGMPIPGNEFALDNIVWRLRFVSLTDWNRFAFWAVPTGILPVLALALWRRQDQISRALTLTSVAFFFFFYFQAYRVLLHHFIPAMLPPLIVMWRLDLMQARTARLAVLAGLVAGTWLAWPRQMNMHDHDRIFARFIATEGPRFDSAAPLDGERFRGFEPRALDTFHSLFDELLVQGYGDEDPVRRFYGAPLVWYYYSEFPKPDGQIVNYTIKPLADATPADGTLYAEHDGYGLYVRDMVLFDTHRNWKLPVDTGAPLLMTPRSIIFGMGAQWPQRISDRFVIDLVPIAKTLLGMQRK